METNKSNYPLSFDFIGHNDNKHKLVGIFTLCKFELFLVQNITVLSTWIFIRKHIEHMFLPTEIFDGKLDTPPNTHVYSKSAGWFVLLRTRVIYKQPVKITGLYIYQRFSTFICDEPIQLSNFSCHLFKNNV